MFDMFRNIIKNFLDGPATRLYPFVTREPFTNVRGQISGIDAELCIFCGICQRKCPALAIAVDKPSKTWTIDQYKCIVCGICAEACPKKCISMDAHYKTPVSHKESLTITQKPKAEI